MAPQDPLTTDDSHAVEDTGDQQVDTPLPTAAVVTEDHWLVRDPIRTGFLVILLVSLGVRFNILRDSYFITDDFMLFSRAVESPLNWDYLGRVHTGHFEPVGFAVMWLLAHLAPWSWGAAVGTMMLGLLLVFVLVWRLLVEVFGRRGMTLVPFALLCFSPLVLPATTWLSAAIIWIPLMASVAGTTRHHVRFLRSGRTADAVKAVAWLTLGLLSFEKTVVILPYLVVLTIAMQPTLALTRNGLWMAIKATRRIWVAYAVTTVAYLAVYSTSLARDEGRASLVIPSPGQVWDFTYLSVFRTFVPSALGGPWRWQPVGYGGALVDSPRFFDWLALIVVAGLIVATVATRRGMVRHWSALLTYIAFSLGLLAAGRVALGGPILALETRYLADAAIPLAMVVGAALMPLRGEPEPWLPFATQLREQWPARVRAVSGLVALGSVLMLSLHAMNSYAAISSTNPYRPFVENVEQSLRDLPQEAQIYDTALPVDIVGPIFEEYNLVSRFIAPKLTPGQRSSLSERREFTNPFFLDSTGRFQPMRVNGAASPTPLPGSCGWPAVNGSVTVPLSSSAFPWGWVVRIGYLTDGDTAAVIHLGDAEQEVHLKKGLGEVFVNLVGSGDEVRVDGMDPDVNVCVGDAQVGNPATK